MSYVTVEVLARVNEAIKVNALRLVEINNKMQAVNRGGVYVLDAPVRAYVGRQMEKRDRAKELQTVLHLVRAEITRLHARGDREEAGLVF